jgi:predicted nuclease of predicted toxin-antitoxin system
MRIKLDEDLPYGLVPILQSLGHEVDTVESERLTGRPDDEVWAAAQADKRFLITQDLDFSDARKYQPGMHEGLLLLRLAQPGRKALTSRIASLFATELVNEWKGTIVIVTERKVRVRRESEAGPNP